MAEERRAHGRLIGAELARIAGPVLGKRGLGEAQLLQHWTSIVGARLAEGSCPERLAFANRDRMHGTLHLAAASGLALEIQHQEPVILERINAFFGYRAVARISLHQGLPAHRTPVAPRLRSLGPEEESALDRRLAAVPDAELRAALKRLGAAMLGRERK
jgi:hypothetical protein